MNITDKIKQKIDDVTGTHLNEDNASELDPEHIVNHEGYDDADDNVLDVMERMHPTTKEIPLNK